MDKELINRVRELTARSLEPGCVGLQPSFISIGMTQTDIDAHVRHCHELAVKIRAGIKHEPS